MSEEQQQEQNTTVDLGIPEGQFSDWNKLDQELAKSGDIEQPVQKPLADMDADLDALLVNKDENPPDSGDNPPLNAASGDSGDDSAGGDGVQLTPENAEGEELSTDSSSEAGDSIDYDQSIQVPMPHGFEAQTIGQLKDYVSDSLLKEQKQSERSNELSLQADTLAEIATSMGNVDPEVMKQIEEYKQQQVVIESRKMLEAIPEWKNVNTYQTDSAEMRKLAKDFGFKDREFDAVGDSRLVRMMHAHVQLQRRIERALVKPEKRMQAHQKRVGKTRVSRPSANAISNKSIAAAARGTNKGAKLAAIESLLG